MRPSLLSVKPGGGSAYHASAVNLDGSTYLTLPAYSGSDSPYIMACGWFRVPTPMTFTFPFDWDAPNTEWLTVYMNPDGSIEGQVEHIVDGASVGILLECHATAGTFTFDANWHSLAYSIDLSSTTSKIWQMYLDDVLVGTVGNTNPASQVTFPFNGTSLSLPDDPSDENPVMTGGIADVQTYVGGSFIDLSVTATRRKFVSASNKPVNPTVAAATLGTQTFLFSGNASGFATNQGSGGAFTLTGALTNASSSPSD